MIYTFSVVDADEDLMLNHATKINELPNINWDSIKRNCHSWCLHPSLIYPKQTLDIYYSQTNTNKVYIETDYNFKTGDTVYLTGLGNLVY